MPERHAYFFFSVLFTREILVWKDVICLVFVGCIYCYAIRWERRDVFKFCIYFLSEASSKNNIFTFFGALCNSEMMGRKALIFWVFCSFASG